MQALKKGLITLVAGLLSGALINPAFSADKTLQQYINEGKEFLQAKKVEDALVSFTKANQLDPKSVPALFYRGNAFCLQGSYENAIADFTLAIRLDPKNGKAYNNRAVAHWYNNEPFKSRADLALAESLGAPVNKLAWKALMDSEKTPEDLKQFPIETITGVFENKSGSKPDTKVKVKPKTTE
jgi:tetratricopeptide (TPR) repeat protein